jgi:hypothetical protein
MLRKPLLLLMLGLLLGAAFVAGVAQLFTLRYQKGDVYPPYSSLRADPLGIKGLFEALGELPGVDAERNYKPLPKLKPAGPITLVYAGVAPSAAWEETELLDFDALVVGGSRAIFTFIPIERSPVAEEEKRLEEEARKEKEAKERALKKPKGEKLGSHRKDSEAKDGSKKEPEKKGKDAGKKGGNGKGRDSEDEGADVSENVVAFREAAKRWGFAFGYLEANEDKAYHRMAVAAPSSGGLDPKISWHTAMYFKDLKPEWKALYICENHPVIIERSFGSGSIVVSADSFFLSNEALRAERAPHLLARLFDGPPEVIFDEEHHHVRDDPGMATLARKYRLQGVVAGLVLLTALFVWKNSVRFLPARKSGVDESGVVAGKESSEGFVNLLRRTIKPSEILGACVGEWRKAFPNRPREIAKVDEIFGQEQARSSRERNTVAAYQAICRILTRQR